MMMQLLSCVCRSGPVFAPVSGSYYVSTTGSDANPGTLASPWLTVAHAAATLVAGETAYVRGGTYTEHDINFTNSGAAGNVITLRNYPTETALIDGGYTVSTGRHPVFLIDGPDYLTFNGLDVSRGATANFYISYNSPTSNITITNCNIYDAVTEDNSANIYLDSLSNNITITNNRIHGRILGGAYNNVGDGIKLFRTNGVSILNNEIYDVVDGIYFKHSNDDHGVVDVSYNFIYDTVHNGIQWSKAESTISHNLILRAGQAGLKFYEEAGTCSSILTYDNLASHNTIVDCVIGVLLNATQTTCDGARDNILQDNLIVDSTGTEYRSVAVWPYDAATDLSNTTMNYNLVYSSTVASPIRVLGTNYTVAASPLAGTGNISAAPTFVNRAGEDFTLTNTSAGYHAASDGTDMGANIALVGIQ